MKVWKKLFSFDRSLEGKVQFWVFLGPFLIIASSCACVLKFSSHDWSMLLAALLGLILCRKWKLRGAAVALTILVVAGTLEYMQRGPNEQFWVAALGSSLAMGMIVTALSLRQASSFFRSNLDENKNFQQKIDHLQHLLKEAQLFVVQEKKEALKDIGVMETHVQEALLEAESYKKLLQVHQYEVQKLRAENEKFVEEVLMKGQKAAALQHALDDANEELNGLKEFKENQEHQAELLDQLNEARVEKFQLEVLNDAYSQNSENKENQLKLLRDELGRIAEELKMATSQEFWGEDHEILEELGKNPQIEKVYKQLTQQFQDKSEILNQTRKELFQVENKLLAVQKECEQNAIDLNPEEIVLTNHLKEVEEECKDLEHQVDCLQELVTELMGKKIIRKSRKAKLLDRANLELTFD
jgi:hypothetical protein